MPACKICRLPYVVVATFTDGARIGQELRKCFASFHEAKA
jgi:hypothetical protein